MNEVYMSFTYSGVSCVLTRSDTIMRMTDLLPASIILLYLVV